MNSLHFRLSGLMFLATILVARPAMAHGHAGAMSHAGLAAASPHIHGAHNFAARWADQVKAVEAGVNEDAGPPVRFSLLTEAAFADDARPVPRYATTYSQEVARRFRLSNVGLGLMSVPATVTGNRLDVSLGGTARGMHGKPLLNLVWHLGQS